jgi:predicted transport protein
MSDLKLFRIANGQCRELEGSSIALEKSLQTLIEKHLDAFLGVRFLASEHSTGHKHAGRIDTLGIDENGCPVIIEYKRSTNENVINQGLFYLDWLMDHQAEFELLVLRRYGQGASDAIEWSSPRLLCIAGDFTRYDEHAVQQINRNIELIRYKRYGEELLALELVNATTASDGATAPGTGGSAPSGKTYKTVTEYLAQSPTELQDRFEALSAYLRNLGDDVQVKTLKLYFAFKRIKNFACVEVRPTNGDLLCYVKVDPSEVPEELKGLTRDVSRIGHFGTGDLEITISSDEDLERAKPLFEKSYEMS